MISAHRTLRMWPVRTYHIAAVGQAALLLASATSALAADVSFREAFEAAAGQDVMVVTVPDSDLLVFDTGAYFTQGKRLVVVAARARLAGETSIGFYPPESRPLPKSGVAATGDPGPPGEHRGCGRSGCPGKVGGLGITGEQGDAGAAASSFLLDIAELEGDGKLILVSAGQAGGRGQDGGKGGTGGRGGDGAERSCGGALGLDTKAGPGNGGKGGQAGSGGKGGPGGLGGAGGSITLSADLVKPLNEGRIVLKLQPAQGGPGGDPGKPGEPGSGGRGGNGNSCGGGGRGGDPGVPGSPGTIGDPGPWGSQGSVRFWLGNDAVAAGSATQTVQQTLRFFRPGLSRDCPEVVPVLLDVKVPDGQVVVQIDSVRLLRLQGATKLIEAPVVRPGATPGRFELAAVFGRQVNLTPRVELPRNILSFPNISLDHSCPALSAQFEASFTVTPVTTPLGGKLAPP